MNLNNDTSPTNANELWKSMFGNSTNATAPLCVVNYRDFIERVDAYTDRRVKLALHLSTLPDSNQRDES